jgi:hypothetical protein
VEADQLVVVDHKVINCGGVYIALEGSHEKCFPVNELGRRVFFIGHVIDEVPHENWVHFHILTNHEKASEASELNLISWLGLLDVFVESVHHIDSYKGQRPVILGDDLASMDKPINQVGSEEATDGRMCVEDAICH